MSRSILVILSSDSRDLPELKEGLRAFFFAHRLLRRTFLPPALVLLNVGLWAAFVGLAPRSETGDVHPVALLLAGAKVDDLVRAGEWWRLLSSVFLHADAMHLAVNCVGIVFVSQLCDNVFGWARTLAIYVIGGACGMAASTFLAEAPSVGASGAVFALMGAVLAFGIWNFGRIPGRLRWALAGGLGVWVIVSLGYGALAEGTDNAAHLGGLVAGAVIGSVSGTRLTILHAAARTPWLAVAVAVLCAMLSAGALAMGARGLSLGFDLPRPALDRARAGGITLPVPAAWTRGRLAGRCVREDASSAAALVASGEGCFRDPWGATVSYMRTSELPSDMVVDPALTAQGGGRVPFTRTEGDVVRAIVVLNKEWSLVMLYWKVMEDKYGPVLRYLVENVAFD